MNNAVDGDDGQADGARAALEAFVRARHAVIVDGAELGARVVADVAVGGDLEQKLAACLERVRLRRRLKNKREVPEGNYRGNSKRQLRCILHR